MNRNRFLLFTFLTLNLLANDPTCGQESSGRFVDELFLPATHSHFSRRGTPLVHLFLIEPAVLHRDFFLDYRIGNNLGGSTDEQELEAELEWAVTKRLGIIIEVPYVGLNPVIAPNTSGFGDITIAGRALIVDRDSYFISGNLGVGMSTGNVSRGLGRGETVISPSITGWHDLGSWFALHTQYGVEIGLDSGDTELSYGLALTKSFQGPVLFPRAVEKRHRRHKHDEDHDHNDHDHEHSFLPGFTSLILEMTGSTGLNGSSSQTFAEIMPGFSYVPVDNVELRFGVRLPLFSPESLDSQFIFTIGRSF